MMLDDLPPRRPALEPALPLINVVFLLLIFFMLAGVLAKRPLVEVTPPESHIANTPEDSQALLLIIKTDGHWYFEDSDTALTREQLVAHVKTLENPSPRIMADADIPLSVLREKLEILREAGIEDIRLVTRSDPSSQQGTADRATTAAPIPMPATPETQP